MAPDERSPALWDGLAAAYDARRPDQGLTAPAVRAAWTALFEKVLPAGRCTILDVGCGTGSLSLLLAESGHAVTGIDFSPGMIAAARAKAAASATNVRFALGDAAAPDLPAISFDAIVCRQALWALPDRRAALSNWATLLHDGGRLILVEGRFASGMGLSESEIVDALPATLTAPEITDLAVEESLWGGPIVDQRILVVTARRPRDTA